jgi:hypothetical protein
VCGLARFGSRRGGGVVQSPTASSRRRAPREGAAARGTLLASPASRTRQTSAASTATALARGPWCGGRDLPRRSPTAASSEFQQLLPRRSVSKPYRSVLFSMTLSHPPTPAPLPSTHPSTKRSAWRFQWTDSVAGHPHMYDSGEVSVSLIRELRKVGD